MFNKNKKKGFTIVELVIVIAVIAILSAVLIPTFAGLIKKAEISNDQTLVRNLNTSLAISSGGGSNKKSTMYDTLLEMQEQGYNVDKLTPTHNNNDIVWDSVNNQFVLVMENGEYYTGTSIDDYSGVEKSTLWKVYTSVPSSSEYSIYLAGTDLTGTVNANGVGVDVGTNANVEVINYTDNGTKAVTIRTNGGVLNVNAPSGTVNHYGNASTVNITAVAGESYHAFGTIGLLNLKKGHVVVESSSTVNTVIVSEGSSDVSVNNSGSISACIGSIDVDGTEPTTKITETKTTLDNNGGYFKLSANQTFDDGLNLNKDTVLDLNGHTITFATGKVLNIYANVTILDSVGTGEIKTEIKGDYFIKVRPNGSLTINSGKISAITDEKVKETDSYAVFIAFGNSSLTINGGEISYKKGSSYNSQFVIGSVITMYSQGSKCYINGGNIYSDGNIIVGNGNPDWAGTYVEINGGTMETPEIAIYHPQEGTLNITGGKITASCAIYQKAGTVNISGGYFKATGEKKDYEYNGSGAESTGDCIIIDSCNYGAPVANINLSNTKIESANGKKVAGYVNNNASEGTIIWNGERVTFINV